MITPNAAPACLDRDGPDRDDLQAMHLGPVGDALLNDAKAEAAQLLEQADRDADSVRTSARGDMDQQLNRARNRADASAQARHQQLIAQARHQAGAIIMEAQEAARAQLVTQLRHEAMHIRNDPRYPRLLDGLEAAVRRQLGPDSTITRDPKDLGGVIGRSGGQSVDYTLPELAERALGPFGQELVELWT